MSTHFQRITCLISHWECSLCYSTRYEIDELKLDFICPTNIEAVSNPGLSREKVTRAVSETKGERLSCVTLGPFSLCGDLPSVQPAGGSHLSCAEPPATI